jgi:Fe2+ transport system protein B
LSIFEKLGGNGSRTKISIALHYISGDGVFYGRRTRSKLIVFLPLILMLYFSLWGFS